MPIFIVTGANGFIGNNIAERILSTLPEELGLPAKQVCTVIASDLPETVTRSTARRFIGSARYQYVDYEQLIGYLEAQPNKPDVVIHNGACSSTTETNLSVFDKLNVSYSQALWNFCVKHNIPFIYASSAATYGDGAQGFSDKKEDCHKYTPLNLYGKSKIDFDLWALKQKNTPPTWFGLRYFNVFGQYESHKGGQASMVYHGYQQATRTGGIRLFQSNTSEYKDGEQLRDFIYVEDIVDITMQLVTLAWKRNADQNSLPLPENGLFLNLGRGVAETWNTLATEVFKALSLQPKIEYIPIPANIINQYQNYTCADLTTLKSIGINHTFQSLPTGITKYVQKYLLRGQ